MKPRSAPVLVGILLLVSPASAQLAISEVLIDPVGKNSGKQIVEVVNTTAKAFTPTGWQICAPLTYAPIPRIQIPSGGVVRFHINTSAGPRCILCFLFGARRTSAGTAED